MYGGSMYMYMYMYVYSLLPPFGIVKRLWKDTVLSASV